MRTILIAATVLLLGAAPALAGDDVMANFYGNTVVSTGAAGESHTHYKPDHTFDVTMTSAMGSMSTKGTWSVADGKLCRTYEQLAPGMTNPVCTPAESHALGETWTVTIGGQVRTGTLKPGIQ